MSAVEPPPCPLCAIPSANVFHEGALVRAIWDAFPVTPGHALLITRRHVPTWFEATREEQAASPAPRSRGLRRSRGGATAAPSVRERFRVVPPEGVPVPLRRWLARAGRHRLRGELEPESHRVDHRRRAQLPRHPRQRPARIRRRREDVREALPRPAHQAAGFRLDR
ncbi:MAG: HIT domain-containing protein [bacterium]|nr:HIT domain-containing protein [bacterium]